MVDIQGPDCFALKPTRLKLGFCTFKSDLLRNYKVTFSLDFVLFTRFCALRVLYGLWFSWPVMIDRQW